VSNEETRQPLAAVTNLSLSCVAMSVVTSMIIVRLATTSPDSPRRGVLVTCAKIGVPPRTENSSTLSTRTRSSMHR